MEKKPTCCNAQHEVFGRLSRSAKSATYDPEEKSALFASLAKSREQSPVQLGRCWSGPLNQAGSAATLRRQCPERLKAQASHCRAVRMRLRFVAVTRKHVAPRAFASLPDQPLALGPATKSLCINHRQQEGAYELLLPPSAKADQSACARVLGREAGPHPSPDCVLGTRSV